MVVTRLEELLSGDVLTVAPELLGWRVRTASGGVTTEVTLTEVEAYAGSDDPASHAFRGATTRNVAMFGPPGTLYVYRSYGIHWCMNVVVGAEGDPSAVLLRGGEPTVGADEMERRRGRGDHLVDGPGKLCQALGVDGSHDGTSVVNGPLRLLPPEGPVSGDVRATTRVGITKATDRPWRFLLTP
ncbi:MAG: DNA-3-methyladenine glycosylase [Actinomycetota bacterium]